MPAFVKRCANCIDCDGWFGDTEMNDSMRAYERQVIIARQKSTKVACTECSTGWRHRMTFLGERPAICTPRSTPHYAVSGLDKNGTFRRRTFGPPRLSRAVGLVAFPASPVRVDYVRSTRTGVE